MINIIGEMLIGISIYFIVFSLILGIRKWK
jgi:hypothetical protein